MQQGGPGRLPTRASWLAGALATCLLLFVAGRCLAPMDETDLFFNLRLGEVVLETGSVPGTNLLSFTHPEARDVNLAWLFQIALVLVHRAGGIPATVLLKTAGVLVTFALLFRVAQRRGAHPAIAALVLALAAWAAEPRFVERPHLVTFMGLGYLLLALERSEAGRPRALWALPALGLLWANGNSCFFLAPAVLALYAAGAWLEGRRGDAGRAALVAALLLPVAFATPAGAGVLGYVANHFRMPGLRPLQEYRPAAWPLDGPFFFLAGAVVLVTAAAARAGGRAGWRTAVPWRQLLPVLALGCLGARRIRFVAEFALLAGPLVAAEATRLARLRGPLGARLAPLSPLLTSAASAAAGLLLLLTVAPRVAAARAGNPVIDLGLEADLVPSRAIDFVERHDLGDRMYNDMEVGSYLLWRWRGRQRVFQDPRINGYPAHFHALLKRADLDQRSWQALLDQHGVRAALITFPTQNPRAPRFDPQRWALLYRGSDGLVFSRREPARRGLIAERELPIGFVRETPASHEADDDDGITIAARPLPQPPAASPVSPCEWQRRLGEHHAAEGAVAVLARGQADFARAEAAFAAALAVPGCLAPDARTRAQRARAGLALRRGAPAAALAALEGLDDGEALASRGFALLRLRRAPEALASFDAALARTDGDANADALFGRALALEATGAHVVMAQTLRAFLARFPHHLAAAAATARLRAHGQGDDAR